MRNVEDHAEKVLCPLSGRLAPELALGVYLKALKASGDHAREQLVKVIIALADFKFEVTDEVIDDMVENVNLGLDHSLQSSI